MKKSSLILLLFLLSLLQAQQIFDFEGVIKLHSLEELYNLDTESLDCSPGLEQVSKSMEAWQEILSNPDQIENDIDQLQKLKVAVNDYRESEGQKKNLLQYHRTKGYFSFVEERDSLFHQWREYDQNLLDGQLTLLDAASSQEDADQCCDKIEELINRLLSEREQIKDQFKKSSIKINIINSKSDKVQKRVESCSKDGIVLNSDNQQQVFITPEQGGASEFEEEPVSASALVSSSDSEDDEDTLNKKQPSDFTEDKPIKITEVDEKGEDLVEYGYGYWARFTLAYPKFMPKGKNAPWYFISRLSANKNTADLIMGDRLLAIWLGKGFYQFTTCDQPENQPNFVKNIDYPVNLDGIWTYIYYSYSTEKKKAVAYIKFGENDFKKIELQVTHPTTKFVRFTVGGTDDKRYPGFNGLLSAIYFSTKKGVYIDNFEDMQARLQSMKRIPKKIIPDIVTYKVTTNPISRKPEDREIHQIIGTSSTPKFPHEYGISGWFKWTPTDKQQEWHTIFRVQIQNPSTDIYLGDRTLSAWVKKSDGGNIHLPTYTITDLEGNGNANLFKNIPHKNRHNQWFFLYFGYSRPLQKAKAYIRWTDSEDHQEYENVRHFTVPKFYIFVGIDKHFPGFSGDIALVAFNIGEGSFRPGNEFRAKNDAFNILVGQKQLLGKQPDDKVKEKDDGDYDNGITITSSTDDNKPKVDETKESQEYLAEYGYGFWARFLTAYPVRLLDGKNAPQYFISRLTSNSNYGNIAMGDRTLAIWLGQGYYQFTTCDKKTNNPNIMQNIDYPNDIEGIWTYIYYSYSAKERKAIAFIKYGDLEPRSIIHNVNHPATIFVRFVLGGKDNNRYPGFNGVLSQIVFSIKNGAFLDTEEDFNDHISRTIIPVHDLDGLYQHELVEDTISRKVNENPIYDELGGGAQSFPHEYAISGWFKWEKTQQEVWHNVFKVQINKPSTDKFLGDRTLSFWIGTAQGGILHFPTYTYTNMNGAGDPNLGGNIVHRDRHLEWFFVYFGYSKNEKKGFVGVKFTGGIETIEYNNVNHYYTPYFYTFIGKDKQNPGFNGKIGYVSFVLGSGTFRKTPYFKHPKDIFGFEKGQSTLVIKRVQKKRQPITDETGQQQFPSAHNQNSPQMIEEFRSEVSFTEYGYGFWARFLTAYPVKLPNGKNAPWYFMARLTQHEYYENVRMGDRILTIFQGQGYYHFATNNIQPDDPNVIRNINYPADIEGIWTHFYFSYSNTGKAVAIVKFDDLDPVLAEFPVKHPDLKYLKLILGGKDQNRYPGFNGQFTQVFYSTSVGAFIDSVDSYNKFLADKTSPLKGGKVPLSTTRIIDSQIDRQVNSDPFKTTVETIFPKEYAFSGWFKWTRPTTLQPWHNLFRVQINTPSTDNDLGDRTLAGWVGNGGIIYLTTYSYGNMNGGGSNNLPQNIAHKNKHFNWFFVYFGYNRNERQGYAYVKWKNSDENLDFQNINHYLVNRFYIFTGRDAQFPGFNGKVAYVSFNVGEGASRRGNEFSHPDDVFRFDKAGQLIPKVDPSKSKVDENTVHVNKVDNNSPRIDEVLRSDDNLVEYGYGFWARFLTAYPVRLIQGKNQPWYFVSRMTISEVYDNLRMGDRALAIWQGQGFYHFTTCNKQNGAVNVIQNINYPDDIEGIWTYIYYSYSTEKQKAIAFIKYGQENFKSITHSVVHPVTQSVRFILGGMDDKRYPAFNGVFTKITYSNEIGVFVDSADKLSVGVVPLVPIELSNTNILDNLIERSVQVAPTEIIVGKDQEIPKLPREYSISGWFRWTPAQQQVWHNIFRVFINSPASDKFLGDRTLSLWLSTLEGGIIQFTTYTYSDMNGAGNPNIGQNIQHQNRHNMWFFVYFGYSKFIKLAYAYVKWKNNEDSLNFANINHYFAPKFYITVGKDKFYPGFNGFVAYVNFNSGRGSFRKGNDYTHADDFFGFSSGKDKLFQRPKQDAPPEVEKALYGSKTSEDAPKVDKASFLTVNNLREYGYGFWLRYLTTYPERQINGKNQQWYFLSRLTWNKDYENLRMGDRTLAIWQGQGFYHFTTCNIQNNDANVFKNVQYPDDIEGLWTFVYYSYNKNENRAKAFIKYGGSDFQEVDHQVIHQPTQYIRFILGGTDVKRYPAFNGLLTQVYFNTQIGAYIGSANAAKKFVNDFSPIPKIRITELISTPIVSDEIERQVTDKPIEVTVEEERLPDEYGISGWFKWAEVAQQEWHNIFRVQIKTPSTDAYLGDRTLACWLGTAEGGILHMPTYSYTNMNGAGNTNYWKNIQHKDRHTQWFWVYFGYSKPKAQAYAYVKWANSEDSLTYDQANHYYSAKYYIFIGKDPHFQGFNGKLNQVSFNIGDGSFRIGNDFTHPNDVFGFRKGQNLVQGPALFKPKVDDNKSLKNAASQVKPLKKNRILRKQH